MRNFARCLPTADMKRGSRCNRTASFLVSSRRCHWSLTDASMRSTPLLFGVKRRRRHRNTWSCLLLNCTPDTIGPNSQIMPLGEIFVKSRTTPIFGTFSVRSRAGTTLSSKVGLNGFFGCPPVSSQFDPWDGAAHEQASDVPRLKAADVCCLLNRNQSRLNLCKKSPQFFIRHDGRSRQSCGCDGCQMPVVCLTSLLPATGFDVAGTANNGFIAYLCVDLPIDSSRAAWLC